MGVERERERERELAGEGGCRVVLRWSVCWLRFMRGTA